MDFRCGRWTERGHAMASVDGNGWSIYEKLVMDKLDEHDARFGNVDEMLTQVRVDIATLKVKAGVWGGIGGLIPVVIALVMFFASKGTAG